MSGSQFFSLNLKIDCYNHQIIIMKQFDLAVIGSGPGGLAATMRALDFGKSVCIIEAGHLVGNGIMNGPLTSKTMWELSADYAVAAAGPGLQGIRVAGGL